MEILFHITQHGGINLGNLICTQLVDLDTELTKSRYHEQFNGQLNTRLVVLIDQWIEANRFQVVNLTDIQQLVKMLRKIRTFDHIGDQNRKSLVKRYLKICPSEIDID